mmetsp:Transcript_65006/g.160060  ORF Transcript_65006/g.160060 Transcript_65006/m.160060 type:complete len:220 (+) Transcript_65006:426-1085(+)
MSLEATNGKIIAKIGSCAEAHWCTAGSELRIFGTTLAAATMIPPPRNPRHSPKKATREAIACTRSSFETSCCARNSARAPDTRVCPATEMGHQRMLIVTHSCRTICIPAVATDPKRVHSPVVAVNENCSISLRADSTPPGATSSFSIAGEGTWRTSRSTSLSSRTRKYSRIEHEAILANTSAAAAPATPHPRIGRKRVSSAILVKVETRVASRILRRSL